ncbi:MAG TPA: 50S ribosomal protein L30 [Thermoplasmatales archaeon]|nr:50S ribosomal protein L30 [Thermoplasmatales archaeon]
MVYAVIRVRGTIHVKPKIKKTLQLLRLNRVNHCVLLDENKVNKGMLQVAKDYVTWGEINRDMLIKLLRNRGKLKGDKPLTDEYLKSSTSYKDISSLADAILEGKIKYKDIPDIKPLFRLHPPKKGYEGIKRSYRNKGALGYRGEDINDLLERMVE